MADIGNLDDAVLVLVLVQVYGQCSQLEQLQRWAAESDERFNRTFYVVTLLACLLQIQVAFTRLLSEVEHGARWPLHMRKEDQDDHDRTVDELNEIVGDKVAHKW